MESFKRWKNFSPIFSEVAGNYCSGGTSDSEGGSRDWPSLPELLLLSIVSRLQTLEDFFAFRGVCRSWRAFAAPSSDSLESQHPLLLVTRFPSYTEAFYDIVRGRLFLAQLPWRVLSRRSLAYSKGYLLTITDAPGAKLLLWNIFTEARIRLPKAPAWFERVRLSSNPSSANCLVLLFAKATAILQYLHIGDPLWTVFHCFRPPQGISDMIFFEDKLYALDAKMQLLAVDLVEDLKYEIIGNGKEQAIMVERHVERWLAISGEELLAVCYNLRGGFDIFSWDFGKNGWRKKLTLGGRALFMGNQGFVGSVVASDIGVRGDCIYYTGLKKDQWFQFSLEDQFSMAVEAVSPGLDRGGTAMPPVWVLPSIC